MLQQKKICFFPDGACTSISIFFSFLGNNFSYFRDSAIWKVKIPISKFFCDITSKQISGLRTTTNIKILIYHHTECLETKKHQWALWLYFLHLSKKTFFYLSEENKNKISHKTPLILFCPKKFCEVTKQNFDVCCSKGRKFVLRLCRKKNFEIWIFISRFQNP